MYSFLSIMKKIDKNTRSLILLLLFPVVLYPLIFVEYIPEIKREDVIFAMTFLYTLIYIFYIIKIWINKVGKTSRAILKSIVIITFGFFHFVAILGLEFNEHFTLGNKEVDYTGNIEKRKVYLVHHRNMLKMHMGHEIGNKGMYFPVYHKIYQTEYHLEFHSVTDSTILFTEYNFVRDGDPVDSKYLLNINLHRVEMDTVQISLKDIK